MRKMNKLPTAATPISAARLDRNDPSHDGADSPPNAQSTRIFKGHGAKTATPAAAHERPAIISSIRRWRRPYRIMRQYLPTIFPNLSEVCESDPARAQESGQARVAKSGHFKRPLRAIHRIKPIIIARMTGHLRDPRAQ